MTNFDLHDQAQQLADTRSAYSLARELLELRAAIITGFPLFDDEGLDEIDHHCEWSMQQDRKRLHALLPAPKPELPCQA